MDKTEKNLLMLVLVLLFAVIALSAVPKPVETISVITPVTAAGAQQTPVIIKPGATMSVMVLSNGAQASVEVI